MKRGVRENDDADRFEEAKERGRKPSRATVEEVAG